MRCRVSSPAARSPEGWWGNGEGGGTGGSSDKNRRRMMRQFEIAVGVGFVSKPVTRRTTNERRGIWR